MPRRAAIVMAGILAVLNLAAAAQAQPPTSVGGSGWALLNLENTIALHGYDPVAYFSQGRAVRGNKRILERVGSGTYYFASRSHRLEFLGNVQRYQPQFGGYCAASLVTGKLEDINPELFLIYRDRLYLFNNQAMLDFFLKDPERAIREATESYFALAARRRDH